MQVVNATYSHWSEPPPAGSDIPERGTDLTIAIRNWPKGYKPEYIVYKNRKSLNAVIDDSTQTPVVITGRIVKASSMLVETSKSTEVSDRLVFSDPDGDTGFIEIKNWRRSDN